MTDIRRGEVGGTGAEGGDEGGAAAGGEEAPEAGGGLEGEGVEVLVASTKDFFFLSMYI